MLENVMDWIAGVPRETATRLEEVKPGRIALEGTISSDDPVAAPIAGTNCAAYYYKSTHMVGSRLKGYIRRRLRDALVYAPELRLTLEGGELPAVPRKSDDWSSDHHRALMSAEYEGFEATEKLIRQGSRVRIIGKVRERSGGEGLEVQFAELHLLGGPETREPKRKKKAGTARKGFRKAPSGKKAGGRRS